MFVCSFVCLFVFCVFPTQHWYQLPIIQSWNIRLFYWFSGTLGSNEKTSIWTNVYPSVVCFLISCQFGLWLSTEPLRIGSKLEPKFTYFSLLSQFENQFSANCLLGIFFVTSSKCCRVRGCIVEPRVVIINLRISVCHNWLKACIW